VIKLRVEVRWSFCLTNKSSSRATSIYGKACGQQ
jgi:hypothetical protein